MKTHDKPRASLRQLFDPRRGLADLLESELREFVVAIVRAELVAVRADLAGAEYYSVQRAAKTAGVIDGTIRRWIREGKIQGYRAGRVVRIKRADLEALLAGDGKSRPMTSQEIRALARRHFG